MWMNYVICWEVDGVETAYLSEEVMGEFRFLRPTRYLSVYAVVFNYLADAQEVFDYRCRMPPVKGKFSIKYLGLGEYKTLRIISL